MTPDILGTAALLRKLLLDEAPLADVVNREYKLTIRYKILQPRGPNQALPTPDFWAAGVALDPASGFPFGSPRTLTKAQFLGTPVILAKGHRLNVRDVINYNAHIVGAVHVQEPRYPNDKALVEVEQWIDAATQGQGPDAVGQQLSAIASVVVTGLSELEAAIATPPDSHDS